MKYMILLYFNMTIYLQAMEPASKPMDEESLQEFLAQFKEEDGIWDLQEMGGRILSKSQTVEEVFLKEIIISANGITQEAFTELGKHLALHYQKFDIYRCTRSKTGQYYLVTLCKTWNLESWKDDVFKNNCFFNVNRLTFLDPKSVESKLEFNKTPLVRKKSFRNLPDQQQKTLD